MRGAVRGAVSVADRHHVLQLSKLLQMSLEVQLLFLNSSILQIERGFQNTKHRVPLDKEQDSPYRFRVIPKPAVLVTLELLSLEILSYT